jgi:predicted transposase/invertase (TIGR01784 family)
LELNLESEVLTIGQDVDLVSPCTDTSFKCIFADDTPESNETLKSFLTDFLDKEVIEVKLLPNEPVVGGIEDKAIRFDVQCTFNDNERANIEMQIQPGEYELERAEYYLSRLFVSQPLKGKEVNYGEIKHSYQITIVLNDSLIKTQKT